MGLLVLANTQAIKQLAQDQATVLAITQAIIQFERKRSSAMTDPTNSCSTPTKMHTTQKVCVVFLMDGIDGWNQMIMFTGPISGYSLGHYKVNFIIRATAFYQLNNGSNQQLVQHSNQDPHHAMLKSLYFLPHGSYQRMESNDYVYRPNISVVLTTLHRQFFSPRE